MIYRYKIKYVAYGDEDSEEGVVTGRSFAEVSKTLEEYYESCSDGILSASIELFRYGEVVPQGRVYIEGWDEKDE